MTDLARIVDDLSKLTVLEASELAKMLEDKWGVSAAAPMAFAPGAAAPGAGPAADESTQTTHRSLQPVGEGGDRRQRPVKFLCGSGAEARRHRIRAGSSLESDIPWWGGPAAPECEP